MAYTRGLNAASQFGDPLILTCTVNVSNAETNVPIKVPWDNVDLTYAYTITTTVIDTGDCALILEIDAADGTSLATATIANSGTAVGTIDEFSMTAGNHASRMNLLNSNIINLSVDGSSGNGQFVLYLYFEPSQYA